MSGALTNAPLTLDASRWYFWQGAFTVAVVLGLAIWGFRNVPGFAHAAPVCRPSVLVHGDGSVLTEP